MANSSEGEAGPTEPTAHGDPPQGGEKRKGPAAPEKQKEKKKAKAGLLLYDKTDQLVLPGLHQYKDTGEMVGGTRKLRLPPEVSLGQKCIFFLLNEFEKPDLVLYSGGVGLAPGNMYDALLVVSLYKLISLVHQMCGKTLMIVQFVGIPVLTRDLTTDVRNAVAATE